MNDQPPDDLTIAQLLRLAQVSFESARRAGRTAALLALCTGALALTNLLLLIALYLERH